MGLITISEMGLIPVATHDLEGATPLYQSEMSSGAWDETYTHHVIHRQDPSSRSHGSIVDENNRNLKMIHFGRPR